LLDTVLFLLIKPFICAFTYMYICIVAWIL
jgi:hypothetical protein